MAYKRMYKRKTKKTFKKKVPFNVKKYVKREINKNIESVPIDNIVGSGSMTPAINPLPLNNVVAGSRNLTEITQLSLLSRVRVAFPATIGNNVSTECRIIWFKWKPISVPTTADILEDTTALQICRSPIQYINYQKFTILSDNRFTLSQGVKMSHTISKYFNKTQQIKFDDTAVPSTATNLTYILFLSDDATPNAPVIRYYTRQMIHDA